MSSTNEKHMGGSYLDWRIILYFLDYQTHANTSL